MTRRADLGLIFDELDYQLACQAYLWALPLVSYAQWSQQHVEGFGATNNDLVHYVSYRDRLGLITANATKPYILTLIDLAATGALVIELPAGPTADGDSDFWQREFGVLGEMGPDGSRGAKHLIVPPGPEHLPHVPACLLGSRAPSDTPGVLALGDNHRRCRRRRFAAGHWRSGANGDVLARLGGGVGALPAGDRMTAATPAPVTIVPANEASWEDLQAVFGTRGDPHRCQCQRFKTPATQWDREWTSGPVGERANRLREQTRCGRPEADTTSGLVAYLDGEPVGWCAVEPRSAYVRLGRVPWVGRAEDKTDAGVWAVTCFVTRTGFRRRGISRALARAAVDFARQRGARALEGFPMLTEPGQEITWGELHVGSRSVFAAAGFAEVGRPTRRRVVMRIDF